MLKTKTKNMNNEVIDYAKRTTLFHFGTPFFVDDSGVELHAN